MSWVAAGANPAIVDCILIWFVADSVARWGNLGTRQRELDQQKALLHGVKRAELVGDQDRETARRGLYGGGRADITCIFRQLAPILNF